MNLKRTLFCLFFGFVLSSLSMAQGYMASKTILDSLQIKKLHGAAELALEIEQATSFKIEVDAKLEFLIAFQKHKLRFAGNVSYNFWNYEDTGNAGYFLLMGDFYQFYLSEKIRKKTPYFFSAFASFQYDFARDLRGRTTIGMTFTFQPLREHKHLCLEPSIGLAGSFQRWQVLKGDNLSTYQHAEPWVKEYIPLFPEGTYDQWDLRFLAILNLMGDWDRIGFNTFVMIGQPFWPSFKADAIKEEALPAELKGCLNTHAYPHIVLNGAFSVRIWKKLAAVTRLEFLWDGGQAASSARNLTYRFTQGLSYQW